MDLSSGYLLPETIQGDRSFDTWFAQASPRLEAQRARAMEALAQVEAAQKGYRGNLPGISGEVHPLSSGTAPAGRRRAWRPGRGTGGHRGAAGHLGHPFRPAEVPRPDGRPRRPRQFLVALGGGNPGGMAGGHGPFGVVRQRPATPARMGGMDGAGNGIFLCRHGSRTAGNHGVC